MAQTTAQQETAPNNTQEKGPNACVVPPRPEVKPSAPKLDLSDIDISEGQQKQLKDAYAYAMGRVQDLPWMNRSNTYVAGSTSFSPLVDVTGMTSGIAGIITDGGRASTNVLLSPRLAYFPGEAIGHAVHQMIHVGMQDKSETEVRAKTTEVLKDLVTDLKGSCEENHKAWGVQLERFLANQSNRRDGK